MNSVSFRDQVHAIQQITGATNELTHPEIFLRAWFKGSPPGFIEIVVDKTKAHYFAKKDIDGLTGFLIDHEDREIYFGPALRKNKVPYRSGKWNVLGSPGCWVDIDQDTKLRDILVKFRQPPNFVVRSGHGWHMYWKFINKEGIGFCDRAEIVERANNTMARVCGGDHVHNIDRLMRLPGSTNTKRNPHTQCFVVDVERYLKDGALFPLLLTQD